MVLAFWCEGEGEGEAIDFGNGSCLKAYAIVTFGDGFMRLVSESVDTCWLLRDACDHVTSCMSSVSNLHS